jgi:Cu/Ag efflux pump CusA
MRLGFALLAFPPLLAAQVPAVKEWQVPWPDARPRDPSVAPDGRVWFVGQAGNFIAVLDPRSGEFKRYEIDPGTMPHNLAVAADGGIWYAGNQPAKLSRRNQFRAVTVSCYPTAGHLPSEVMKAAAPALKRFARDLPPGFRMEIAGEQEKQQEGFGNLAVVMAISIALIYIALVLQFKNTVKPLLVFAAIPYGIVGALAALYIMGTPFGFMAFLGVASLIGVIVSHVIVLFDFIEEAHERGESLIESLLDAGILRLRPVLITVGATVLALFPLSLHGGPLWEPLCYAQIGGLTFATFVTLLLVPVLYAIFVLDLKWVKWEKPAEGGPH